ncbi:hypothetical protein WA026_001335 [Henosepilachna vigintioctopunctata]|uniref:Uncharacterized protein n=1 Tax=Henosepilachna vigintioctopunctata TaxID=420089 RepID=A0AAW1UUA5_9CUCU
MGIAQDNMKEGFRKSGIYPIDRNQVLERLPSYVIGRISIGCESDLSAVTVGECLIQQITKKKEELTQRRPTTARRKKVNVQAGKSITAEEVIIGRVTINENRNPVSCIPIARLAASRKNVDEDTSSDDMSSASVPLRNDSLNWTPENIDDDLIPQHPTVTEPNDAQKDLNHLPEGTFVPVNYEGVLYPGDIFEQKRVGYSISAMVKSGNNWKWPDKADILNYLAEDVKQVIDKPIKMGRRDIYSVKELRSYLEL